HPAPAPKPTPKPKAPPKPTPKAAAKVNPAELVARGWDQVDDDPGAALTLFDQAARANPSLAEPHYGRGYALVRLSRKDEAVAAYCKAIGLGDSILRREIRSVMQQNGLVCP
ncbi:MAG: hypothetical protein ABMA64_15425, partial [Myxococcota bacterium]